MVQSNTCVLPMGRGWNRGVSWVSFKIWPRKLGHSKFLWLRQDHEPRESGQPCLRRLQELSAESGKVSWWSWCINGFTTFFSTLMFAHSTNRSNRHIYIYWYISILHVNQSHLHDFGQFKARSAVYPLEFHLKPIQICVVGQTRPPKRRSCLDLPYRNGRYMAHVNSWYV